MSEELDDDDVIEHEGLEEGIEDVSEELEEKQQTEEEDKESYSKRVQKRIDKIHWKFSTELEKRDREAAELKAELEALRKAQQEQHEERSNQSLEQSRKELLDRRKEALEIGDYDEVNNIDDKLLDIKIQAKAPVQKPVVRQEPPARQEPINEAMAAWQQKNSWVFESTNRSRVEKANAVLAKILEDGFDVDEPETYAELDKRLKREMPPPTGAPDRGQVAGGDRGFTAEDRKMMIGFGLNPNDPKVRKLWIKNKG
jgi:hypothetical protein